MDYSIQNEARWRRDLAFAMLAAIFVISFVVFHPISQPYFAEFRGTTFTIPNLGSAQGLSVHDGKIYMYGDLVEAKPRVGVIREYDMNFRPTGRSILLTKNGSPLITHPTGLTWHPQFGCFLGDTANRKSIIYRVDWHRAMIEAVLDNAVRDVVVDDAAINGGRPEFVSLNGKPFLATADYGDVTPQLRLYDPEKMLAAGRTSVPGVVAHRISVGPFNQNLHWDESTGHITMVQNTTPGLGWRLDVLNLAKAVEAKSADGPGARVERYDLIYKDELEGYRPLPDGRATFLSSSGHQNLRVGKISQR